MPWTAAAISPLTFATACVDALAAPRRAAVAQLRRLELAGRRAGRHRGAAEGARAQRDLGLDGGVAARVEDLAGVDAFDLTQGFAPSLGRLQASLGVVGDLAGRGRARSSARRGRRRAPRPAPRRRGSGRSTERSASSGSTCSLRATFTAAKSRSPAARNAASRSSPAASSSSTPARTAS